MNFLDGLVEGERGKTIREDGKNFLANVMDGLREEMGDATESWRWERKIVIFHGQG